MSSVSVVLAARNGGRHIGRQLETLGEQTLLPAELIVVDDGSTDDTLDIVEAFAMRAPFPVSLQPGVSGAAAQENIMAAALSCRSRYVAFCSQDDEWHPDKLFCCVSALNRDHAVICAHAVTLIDGTSDYVGFLSQGITRGKLHPALALPPFGQYLLSSQVVRRSLLDVIPRTAQAGAGRYEPTSCERWVYVLGTSLGSTVTLARPLMARRQPLSPGAGSPWDVLVRWSGRARGSTEMLRQHHAEAEQCARMMSYLAQDVDGPFASPAAHAAHQWRLVAQTLAARRAPGQSSSLRGRATELRRRWPGIRAKDRVVDQPVPAEEQR